MPTDTVLEAILEKVRELRNFDFRSYKRATLGRRIERRMSERRVKSQAEYLTLLQRDTVEVDALVAAMLIKVTGFFRDEELWVQLSHKILPELLASRRPADELRIWSAGCATGEEAYSIAMVLADIIGDGLTSVKIFGTDVEEASIVQARRGIYTRQQVTNVSKERLKRFFTPCPEGFQISQEVRRSVVFGVNNLVSDAPISHLDMIMCRNVFIYLNADLQKRVLSRFHYGLRADGVLVLGKAELIPFASKIFEVIDIPNRVYKKGELFEAAVRPHERLALLADESLVPRVVAIAQTPPSLVQEILDTIPTPLVVVAGDDATVHFWGSASARLWGRSAEDVVGRRLSSLGLSGLGSDAVVAASQRVREGKVDREQVETMLTRAGGVSGHYRLEIARLHRSKDKALLFTLHADEEIRELKSELQRVTQEVSAGQDKLRTSNENLRASNEELETTNEELQSANEELQTTNEELQSANEELETTNEELQSANEELDEINRELAHRTDQMNLLALYQRTIIRSLTTAVVVLDLDGRVTAWNLAAERLLGLPESEALGQTFWTLRVPALSRSLVQRIRDSIDENRALRVADLEYETPTGGTGHATMVAIPLMQEQSNLGTVLLFDDSTRMHALNVENVAMKKRDDVARKPRKPRKPGDGEK